MATYTDCNGNTQEYNPHLYDLARCSTGYYCGEYTTSYCYGYYLVSKAPPYSSVSSKYKGSIKSILNDIKSKSSYFSYSSPSFHSKGKYDNWEWGYYTFKIYLSNEIEISLVIYQDYHDYVTPIICGHELYSEYYFDVRKGQKILDSLGSHNFSDSRDVIDYLYKLVSKYNTYKNLCCLKKC